MKVAREPVVLASSLSLFVGEGSVHTPRLFRALCALGHERKEDGMNDPELRYLNDEP